jgi:hypothetical protein
LVQFRGFSFWRESDSLRTYTQAIDIGICYLCKVLNAGDMLALETWRMLADDEASSIQSSLTAATVTIPSHISDGNCLSSQGSYGDGDSHNLATSFACSSI